MQLMMRSLLFDDAASWAAESMTSRSVMTKVAHHLQLGDARELMERTNQDCEICPCLLISSSLQAFLNK
jgi:hypothetical protein